MRHPYSVRHQRIFISGVYAIKNIINGKCYIGSSIGINMRWHHHKSDLYRNEHGNTYLQHAYNKYGEDNFKYTVLETCVESQLITREQYWIDLERSLSSQNGYNICPMANGSKISEATKKKISESVKRSMTPALRKKLSAAKIGNTYGLGYRHTPATIAQLRISQKGKHSIGHPCSNATKEKLRLCNLGKHCSEATKVKISKIHTGRIISLSTKHLMSLARKKRWSTLSNAQKSAIALKGHVTRLQVAA